MKNQNLESIKKQLVETINKKLEDKIIEKSNADLIVKLINRADTVKEAVDIAALGTTYKRTGFHFDKRLDKIVNNGRIKYFKKNNELSFSDERDVVGASSTSPSVNKLIIGDNFDALQNLLIQYKNSIDVIYIDPPYGKDSMGQFAETNYNNALTRDNLLSMLYLRLVLAKELLSDDGVIFCSIDDRNQAYVKCLFDEVFGERNFIVNFVVNSAPAGQQSSEYVAIQQSYCLMYRKSDSFEVNRIELSEDDLDVKYKDGEEEGVRYYIERIWKRGVGGKKEDVPSLHFPVCFDKKLNNIYIDDEIESIPKGERDKLVKIIPYHTKGVLGRWTWARETMKENRKSLYVKFTSGEYKLYKKVWENEETGTMMKSIIESDIGRTELGSLELKSIMNDKVFLYPKSTLFIKTLINLQPNKFAKVLDFFAGSGTTGQAVLELNKQDGGNRQFVLCQLDEITETTPNGIVKDVTSKRLKRVMTGECYDGSKDFDWIKKNEPLGGSLDVYEINSVANNESTEGQTAFDLIDETLYGKEKFTNLQDKIDWVCSNFENCQKELKE